MQRITVQRAIPNHPFISLIFTIILPSTENRPCYHKHQNILFLAKVTLVGQQRTREAHSHFHNVLSALPLLLVYLHVFSTKVIKQSGPHISRKKTTVIKNPPPSSSTSSRDRLPTNVLPVKPKQPTAPPVNFTKRPSPSYGSQGHAVSPHNPTVSSTVSNTKPLSPSLSSTTTSSSASARSGGNPAVMSMPYR